MDPRLLAVVSELPGGRHADVGTDHAKLPLYLLDHQICQKLVVTEKSEAAFRVARQALWGRAAEVRLGDGLGPLKAGEVDSVSLCGMGGSLIAKILQKEPEKVPAVVVAQANRDSFKVRQWAREAGFHVVNEQLVKGSRVFEVLTFHRLSGADPAYAKAPLELGLHFGPTLLKMAHPLLDKELKRRIGLYREEHPLNQDLQRLKKALEFLQSGRL